VVNGVKANRIYEIDEAGASADPSSHKPSNIQHPTSNIQRPTGGAGSNPQPRVAPKPDEGGSTLDPRPVFEDVSRLVQHTHHEEEFNDFERQPLLPHKLSQLGPGVSWSDVDGDGREDLLVGSGRGGQLEIFLNQGKGQFQRLPMGALVGRAGDDQTTVIGWAGGEEARGFVVGQANYETKGTNGVKRYEMWAGGIPAKEVLGTGLSSVGPLAMGDMNGGGNL